MRKPGYILLLIALFTIFSCDVGVNNNTTKKEDDPQGPAPTPIPTTPPVDTGCFADGVGASSTNYYTFNITGKGWEDPNKIGWAASHIPGLRGYDSAATEYYMNQFKTDGRFNVRVVAQTGVGDTTDEYGNACTNNPRPYTKLQLKVRAKAIGSSYYQDHIFTGVPVNGCSDVYEFNVPAASNPIDIQILSVNWDYDCIFYIQRGCGVDENDPGCADACPWRHVNKNSCYRIDVQLSTAYTKDIPH